jgi:hypothetical protein
MQKAASTTTKNMFNFEDFIALIQARLSRGGTYRIWGVKIKQLQFLNQTTLRCIYVNTRPDSRTGLVHFVEKAAQNNTPTIQQQVLLDIGTPGQLIIADEEGITTTVASIREFHCVLSTAVPIST